VQNHGRTEAARGRDLDQRSRLRHHHRHCDSEARAVSGDGLSVIAGACGDHAASTLFARQSLQAVTGATLFERARELQILQFQQQLDAGQLGQGGALDARSAPYFARNTALCGNDVG